MRAHPHGAANLATLLRTKPFEQVLVVELLGDGGEDGGPAHGAQAQHPQSFALGRIALLLAQVLMYGFVLARAAHAVAYATAQSHEVRSVFYTIGSLSVIYMAVHVLVVALTSGVLA